jgi:hypothetical protein
MIDSLHKSKNLRIIETTPYLLFKTQNLSCGHLKRRTLAQKKTV